MTAGDFFTSGNVTGVGKDEDCETETDTER